MPLPEPLPDMDFKKKKKWACLLDFKTPLYKELIG